MKADSSMITLALYGSIDIMKTSKVLRAVLIAHV